MTEFENAYWLSYKQGLEVYTENADKSTIKLNKCIVVFKYVEMKGKLKPKIWNVRLPKA